MLLEHVFLGSDVVAEVAGGEIDGLAFGDGEAGELDDVADGVGTSDVERNGVGGSGSDVDGEVFSGAEPWCCFEDGVVPGADDGE